VERIFARARGIPSSPASIMSQSWRAGKAQQTVSCGIYAAGVASAYGGKRPPLAAHQAARGRATSEADDGATGVEATSRSLGQAMQQGSGLGRRRGRRAAHLRLLRRSGRPAGGGTGRWRRPVDAAGRGRGAAAFVRGRRRRVARGKESNRYVV
jgi:hypothetical protein